MMPTRYDQEGDFPEITLRDAAGCLQEIEEDIYEQAGERGNLWDVESDLSDYLRELEDYEERLARGEIRW